MYPQIRRWFLGVVVAAGILAGGSLSSAAGATDSEANRKRAGALVDQGVELFQRDDYQAALDRFEEAYRIFPSSKILVNIGGALRKLGREVEAADIYERYLEASAEDRGTRVEEKSSGETRLERSWQSSESRIAAVLVDLRKRIGRLRLSIQPIGATVVVDGQAVQVPKDRPLYVYPGMHRIEVNAPGHDARNQLVGVAAGEERAIGIGLTEIGQRPTVPESSLAHLSGRPRTWTWVAAGTAVALLAGGLAVTLHAHSVYQDYEDASRRGDLAVGEDRFSQSQTEATVATVLFAAGGAAAVGAGMLYFFEGRPASPARARVGPGPGTAGIAVGGRF